MFLAKKLNRGAGTPAPKDPQFNYVTMLLHGDGTNGAQNNTFVDSSTNNFTITRNGNTTQGSFSPYGSNWSNYFKTSDSIYFASNASYGVGTGNFTVEFWFSPSVFGSNQLRYFLLGQNGSTRIGIENDANGALNVYVGANSASITYNWTPNINEWYHIAVVRSGTTVTLYINGISVATATNSNSVVADTLFVGGLNWASGYGAQAYISNLRFTNTAVYTSAFSPSTTPLTAISGTLLLTCQSNRFLDNSSIGATALNGNGTPSVQRFNPFGTSTAYSTSVIGGSGYFDGSGDSLSIADNAALDFGSGDFTVEGWFWASSNSGYVVSKYEPSNQASYIVGFGSSTTWEVYVYSTGGASLVYSGAAPAPNQWVHFALERNGANNEFYFNGTRVAQVSAVTLRDSTAKLAIGNLGASYDAHFNGYVSNLRVVKGTAVYSGTTYTVPTSPLTAITNTSLLTNFTNGAIFDNAMMNDLRTVGNSQISTSVVKFGTGSISGFSAGNNYQAISYAGANVGNFGSGDFTVECWINVNSSNTGAGVLTQATSGGAASTSWGFFLNYTSSTSIDFYLSNGSSYFANTGGGNVNDSAWHHIAFSRSGSSGKLFLDGTQVGSTLSLGTTVLGNGTLPINIGGQGNATFMAQGYIDDIRITKGYARYTANFTPPIAALPDIGPI